MCPAAVGARSLRAKRLQSRNDGAARSSRGPGPAPDDPMNERRTSVPSEAAQLPVLAKFLHEFWSAAQLQPAESLPFEIALEEIFMNVVTHGTPTGSQNRVEICLALAEDNLTLAVEDEGPPFDPLSVQAPDLNARLEDRQVGGLGV